MSVLQTRQDFYDLTRAYLDRVHMDGVTHVEIMFDPQGHTERGIAFETVIDGILDALASAEADYGMTSHLILSFLRHLSEDAAFDTLAQAEPYLDRIMAVGLDSSELGHPPSKFARVFTRARAMGLKAVAHGGEEGPPSYVWEALDMLNIDRLDHGNRSLEDDALVHRLVDEQMVLTVCPLSNVKLCVVDDMTVHPLKTMLDLGLKVTVNSDDPSYFGGYINDNYIEVASALNLTRAHLADLARNSFTGSFLDNTKQQAACAAIDAYLATTM